MADTDLRTQDTEAHFRSAMLQWPTITRVRQALGLHPPFAMLDGLLFEDPFDFTNEYPLAHDEHGRVVQTRDRKPLEGGR